MSNRQSELLVGNSLSMCVADLLDIPMSELLSLDAKLSLARVGLIRCSFKPPKNEHAWESILDSYAKNYWCRRPLVGKNIARILRNTCRLAFTCGHYIKDKWGSGDLRLHDDTPDGRPRWLSLEACLQSIDGAKQKKDVETKREPDSAACEGR